MTANNTLLQRNIQNLVISSGLPEAEVARRAGVKQTTLHRIVSGKTTNPRAASLELLADYFNCKVKDFFSDKARTNEVPLISWTHAALLDPKNSLSEQKAICSVDVSSSAFAVKMNDSSMDMVIQESAILIIDPCREAVDRSLAIVYLNKDEKILCRQLIIDGVDVYIKPLSLNLFNANVIKLTSKDKILGILVQSIMNF